MFLTARTLPLFLSLGSLRYCGYCGERKCEWYITYVWVYELLLTDFSRQHKDGPFIEVTRKHGHVKPTLDQHEQRHSWCCFSMWPGGPMFKTFFWFHPKNMHKLPLENPVSWRLCVHDQDHRSYSIIRLLSACTRNQQQWLNSSHQTFSNWPMDRSTAELIQQCLPWYQSQVHIIDYCSREKYL